MNRWPLDRNRTMQDMIVLFASRLIFTKLEQTSTRVLRIKDVARTTSGGTPSRNKPEYFKGTIPWLKSGELNDGLIDRAEEHISEEALKNSNAKLFPRGTLLIALYGATTGKTGILGLDAATNQAICAVFPRKGVERDYLFWYFRMKRVDFLSSSYGGAQPNISQKVINESLIPVPSAELQNKIVSFLYAISLDTFDLNSFKICEPLTDIPRKIITIKTTMQKIERLRKLMEESVRDAEELVQAEISALFSKGKQKGWIEKQLKSYVVDDCYGTSEKASDDNTGTPVLRMGNIQNGRLALQDIKYLHLSDKNRERLLLKKGDILVNRTNSAELVGKCAVFDLEGQYAFASYLIRLRLDLARADPKLVAWYINSPTGRAYMFSQRKQMTGQANVNATKLKALPIALPEVREQRRIVAQLDCVQRKIDEIVILQSESKNEMEELIPSILDQKLAGYLAEIRTS